MPVLTNVILPWNGNNGSIPAGWTRATNLDGKIKKSYGAEAVAVNGGSDQHSHASSAHTHTKTDTHSHAVSYQQVNNTASYGGSPNQDPIAQANHNHSSSTVGGSGTFDKNGTKNRTTGGDAASTVVYPSVNGNNLPPYHEVIYLKASAGASLKQNHIVYTDINSVPTGWQIPDGTNGYPDMRNRYLRGAAALGNAGTQSGSLTHTHDLSHSHSTTHYHEGITGTDDNHPTRTNGGGSGGNKTGSHEHYVLLNTATVSTDTYSGSVTSGTVEPAYYKLLALINSGTGPWKKGMIAMFEDDASLIPAGWKICNGQQWTDKTRNTPDLRDKFIKIANTGAEIGTTGGANTHDHPASNSHSHSQAAAHSHSGSMGGEGGNTASGGSTSTSNHTHGFASIGNNSATMTWGASTMTGESVNNQPAYRTVYFIQLERLGGGSIMLNLV